MDVPALRESETAFLCCFVPMWALDGLDDDGPHWGGLSSPLSPPTQMLGTLLSQII